MHRGEIPIPPGPAGQPVHVRFTYDINGLLEVEAIFPQSDVRHKLVLRNHCSSMSDDEIEQAVRKMQKLKFYPRDDLKNRQLVLFCERMVGEVSPHQRQELEEAIDMFEHAMSAGDPERFNQTREYLLTSLQGMGIGYSEDADG